MKKVEDIGIVLVTAPNMEVARSLAGAALEARLAACANLIPAIESHYWWQGKLESSQEVLIIFKSIHPKLDALERLVLDNHPYDTPEIVHLPVTAATEKYLSWWRESVS